MKDGAWKRRASQEPMKTPKPLKAHQQERGSSYPPKPPVRFVDRKTVLAGKGSLSPRQNRRALAGSAPFCPEDGATGGSGGNEDRGQL
jgi:hypothetical protein